MFLLKYILSWFLNMGEQSEDLQKVVDFLAIRLRHARTLLIHHQWNVESLFGNLAETGTNEIFLETLGSEIYEPNSYTLNNKA
jgi:hypothetical protein